MKSTPVMGESSIVLTFKGISCPLSKKLVQKRTRIKTINPQNNKTVTSVWIYNREMTCQERRNRVNQRGSQIFRKNKLAIERFFRSPLALMFWRWFWRSLAVQRRILRSPGVFSARATLQRGLSKGEESRAFCFCETSEMKTLIFMFLKVYSLFFEKSVFWFLKNTLETLVRSRG